MAGPSVTTIKRLFALSGNQCAFHGCSERLVNGDVLVGEICHIKGSKLGAPRYDATKSESDRHGFDNLILLCANHHKVADTDLRAYTVKELRDMKYVHETRRADVFEISDRFAERIAIAMAGAGAALTIAEVARGLGQFAGAIANALGEPNKAKELDEILRYAPKGTFSCSYKYEQLAPLCEAFSQLFSRSGWRKEDWSTSGQRVIAPSRDWKNDYAACFVFLWKDPHQVSTAREAVHEVFAKTGLVGESFRDGFRLKENPDQLMLVAVGPRPW